MKQKFDDPWAKKIRENLEELSQNISEVFESVQVIMEPIRETTENVPKATSQLDKITEQTEKATHKILDKLERMTDRGGSALDLIAKARENLTDGEKDKIARDVLGKLEESVSTDIEDAYIIMEILQFQDITTQQIDYIRSLLEVIELKLTSLLSVLGQVDVRKSYSGKMSYDPNAEFTNASERQAEVDRLLSGEKKE